MDETKALWHATFRKEAMDLITRLWGTLDQANRERLSQALVDGPPEEMLAHIAQEDRDTSRDRRIYDRIIVIERLQEPPLTSALADKMAEIRRRHPEWRAAEGEQAHFGSWMGMQWGPETRYSVDDLAALIDEDLIAALRHDRDRREGLLDSWKQLVIAQPRRGFAILEAMGAADDHGPADAWEYGLWGLREAENAGELIDRMMSLLADLPNSLFTNRDVVRGAADLLEAKSRSASQSPGVPAFWKLFDRAIYAAETSATEVAEADPQRDWVSAAVNGTMGRLATAFVNELFARRPKVGEGLPKDLVERATRLMSPRLESHRLARVIGASRISYLYAIDPNWTRETLIPCFGWGDEDEAIAMWQGYAWQARIDPQLWAALKPCFLPLFRSDRLGRLGSWGRNIAQTLMLVGIAFGGEELKRDEVRDAIRAMPDRMQTEAAWWISSYMAAGTDDERDDEEPIEGAPDRRWTHKIWPWLKRVWPHEKDLRIPEVAEQFALAAIATEAEFPNAVDNVINYAARSHAHQLIDALRRSSHPDIHPRAALKLLDALVERDQVILFQQDLADIVRRIGTAAPELASDNLYRIWHDFVAQTVIR